MKKMILIITTCTFIAGVILTGCNSSSQKADSEQSNTEESKYLTDIENYRKATADKIAANEKSMAEFKVRIENEKKEARADYEKKIAELQQKNSDLKKKMDDYKAEGKEKWEKFKTEFNHDMDELGKAVKDLVVNNVK